MHKFACSNCGKVGSVFWWKRHGRWFLQKWKWGLLQNPERRWEPIQLRSPELLWRKSWWASPTFQKRNGVETEAMLGLCEVWSRSHVAQVATCWESGGGANILLPAWYVAHQDVLHIQEHLRYGTFFWDVGAEVVPLTAALTFGLFGRQRFGGFPMPQINCSTVNFPYRQVSSFWPKTALGRWDRKEASKARFSLQRWCELAWKSVIKNSTELRVRGQWRKDCMAPGSWIFSVCWIQDHFQFSPSGRLRKKLNFHTFPISWLFPKCFCRDTHLTSNAFPAALTCKMDIHTRRVHLCF